MTDEELPPGWDLEDSLRDAGESSESSGSRASQFGKEVRRSSRKVVVPLVVVPLTAAALVAGYHITAKYNQWWPFSKSPHSVYEVQREDNLWDIVSKHYGNELHDIQREYGFKSRDATIAWIVNQVVKYNMDQQGVDKSFDTHAFWSKGKYNRTPRGKLPKVFRGTRNGYHVGAKDRIPDSFEYSRLRKGQQVYLPRR